METQNVTLAIPKELLQQAKLMAVQKQISLSRLLIEQLAEAVSKQDAYEAAKRRSLDLMSKGFDLGTNGQPTWTREELHERR